MTFLEELKRLLDERKSNKNSMPFVHIQIADHLFNHAEALADLVEAAQHVVGKVDNPLPLNEALVLLNDCVNALERENKE